MIASGLGIVDHVGSKAGMDYYSLELARAFAREGIACTYYSNLPDQVQSCVQIRHCFAERTPSNVLLKAVDFCFGFLKAFVLCRKSGHQHVIHHVYSAGIREWYVMLLAMLFRLRVIVVVHDVSALAGTESLRLRGRIYNLAWGIVVHNDFSAREIRPQLSATNVSKLATIAHGHFIRLADPAISRSDARKQLGIDSDRKVVLFFGQIKKVKGLDVLLHAMAHLPAGITLLIAGKPWKDSFDSYQQIIDKYEMSDRVHLRIRYIRDDERELFLKACDVLVLPYQQIYQSGVLLMAMSYQLPVIASDLVPMQEIITHRKNGLLFAAGDPFDLAQKIKEAFDNPVMTKSMSVSGFADMQANHDWDHIARKYIQQFMTS